MITVNAMGDNCPIPDTIHVLHIENMKSEISL